MRRLHHWATLLILAFLAVSSLRAELLTEATVSGGYFGNLFSDSNSISDSYASTGLNLQYYPSGSVQLYTGAFYNTFAENSDLSNLVADVSVSVIPTPAESPFIMGFDASLSTRKFGTLYDLYDQTDVSVSTDIGYAVSPGIHVHTSASYVNASYTNSDFGSNNGIDLAAGVSVSFLEINTFAVKVEYTNRSFDQPTLVDNSLGLALDSAQCDTRTFEISSIQLRYSRPLGSRTGINLSTGYRLLHVDRDFAALGYTIDHLSPWSELWEGASVSSEIKHYFPRQIIAELSVAYFEKSYVDVIEFDGNSDDPFWKDSRDDKLVRSILTISRPVSLKGDKLLTPSLELGYRHNQSSTKFFEYDDPWATLSLTLSM